MASVVARRALSRNLCKFHEFHQISLQARYTSAFLIKHDWRNVTVETRRPQINFIDIKQFSKISNNSKENKEKCEVKPTIFQRFKQMYKEYWYVLLPVHLVTSAAWFGGFYYLAKSGVDIASLLESWNVSDKIVNPLRDSSMGYLAVAYALYKIATPVRYTVTLGGTTVSINYLKKWGYIKPVPSTEKLRKMYYEKKDNLMETVRETREGFKVQSEKFKDKKDDIIEDFDKSIKQIKELGDKIKKEHVMEKVKKEVKTPKG